MPPLTCKWRDSGFHPAWFCFQMIADSLRWFAQENFSDKYFPILHGETGNVKPLALVVKQRRSIWKRPFAKSEMVILAGLEKYVESGAEEAFLESVKLKIKKRGVLKDTKHWHGVQVGISL